MRLTEPSPFLLRLARWEPTVTVLRHGGSCPTAVRPLARPAHAEAFLLSPGSQSRRRSGGDPPPAPLFLRRLSEDAGARTESGESSVTLKSRGLASAAVTYTPFKAARLM